MEIRESPTLLIGSVPHSFLERIVRDLRKRPGQADIWLITLEEPRRVFADRVILYTDQGSAVANLRHRARLFRELRAAAPREVVLPMLSGEVYTVSNMALIGSLLGVPIRVCDETLVYRDQRSGIRTALWHFGRTLVLSQLPRVPRPPRLLAPRLGSGLRARAVYYPTMAARYSARLPWLLLAYRLAAPLRIVAASVRAIWLLARAALR